MKTNSKFLIMVATVGLALSISAQAQDSKIDNQTAPNNQATNSTMEGAKDLLGKTFSFGKTALKSVVNSEPVQEVKKTAVKVYKSEPVQEVKDTVVTTTKTVYKSKPVQEVKNGIVSIASAGKEKVSDLNHGVTEYKQNALAKKGLTETSDEDSKKSAYGEANSAAIGSFFNNLLKKTQDATNSAANTVQNATSPTDPIANIEASEKYQKTVVGHGQVMKNVKNIRNNATTPKQKTKYQNN